MEKLLIKKPLHLIQQIRLVHAITEADYDVCVPDTQFDKFAIFNKHIGIELGKVSDPITDIAEHLHISHKEPLT
jgi:hypothetical protein